MYDKNKRQIDVQMLVRRAHIEIAAGGSLERLLTATPRDVLALMPLDLRTPDEVPGSIYGAIARGDVTPRYGRQMMDTACVNHTDYAWSWLVHAECQHIGLTPATISMAELMDLPEQLPPIHRISHDLRAPDALDIAVA